MRANPLTEIVLTGCAWGFMARLVRWTVIDMQVQALTLLLQMALMVLAWLYGANWGYFRGFRAGQQQGQRWAARASGLGELTETARAVNEQEGTD